MPKKPTQPFGGIVFPKHGPARPEFGRLPDDKEAQELAAFEIFVAKYNLIAGQARLVAAVEQLPIDGHDFSCFVGTDETTVQLTELVGRAYLRSDPPEGQQEVRVQLMAIGGAKYIDTNAENDALRNTIRAKIQKYYAPPEHGRLWLVVFSTAPYSLEHVKNGVLHVTIALKRAREYIRDCGAGPFSEIWFTDLRTRPICVWPVVGDEPPLDEGA